MRNLVKVFKALSDSNRIRIIKMLEQRRLCVCEITEVLKLASSTVSKHLSILRDAELILDEKDGTMCTFSVICCPEEPMTIIVMKYTTAFCVADNTNFRDELNIYDWQTCTHISMKQDISI